MAFKKRYYRRIGRKRRRTSRYGRRSSKYSGGNRRTGGLYRLAGKSRGQRRKLRGELKYLNWVFSNDNCTEFNGGTAALNGPGQDGEFNGFSGNNWFLVASQTPLAGGPAPDNWVGLCRPAQGAGAQNRIGRKITLTSVTFRMKMQESADVVQNINQGGGARLILFIDTQANGTYPSTSTFFDATVTANSGSALASGGIGAEQLLNNIENTQRFKILMDKEIYINSSSVQAFDGVGNLNGGLIQGKTKYYKKYIKLPNIEIEMGGSTSNPNLCKSNALHLAVRPIGAKTFINIVGRTRFSDM